MKWIRIIALLALGVFVVYFAFAKPDKLNIEGQWSTDEITLNGVKIYPKSVTEYFDLIPYVVVSDWNNTISFPRRKSRIVASYQLRQDDGNYQINLKSNEKALNGDFKLSLDTVHSGSNNYKVSLEMTQNRTRLRLQREVYDLPSEPEFPRKGRP